MLSLPDPVILEILRELIAGGRIPRETTLDGEAITVDERWQPNGWSKDSVDGCFEHRLISEAVVVFRASDDPHEREAGERFPTHFTMNLTRYPAMRPSNQAEVDLAIAARNRWFTLKHFIHPIRNPMMILPFETRGGYKNSQCGVVLGGNQPNLPDIFPEFAVNELNDLAARLRNHVEHDFS